MALTESGSRCFSFGGKGGNDEAQAHPRRTGRADVLGLRTPAQAVTRIGDALLSGASFDAALLDRINRERVARGLRPFAGDPALKDAARQAAAIMANQRVMEHEIPGTPDLPARLRSARARVRTAGENSLRDNLGRYGLDCNAVTTPLLDRLAAEVARASAWRWIGSPPHLANISNPRFKRAGAAFAIVINEPGCGQLYVAQVFAG